MCRKSGGVEDSPACRARLRQRVESYVHELLDLSLLEALLELGFLGFCQAGSIGSALGAVLPYFLVDYSCIPVHCVVKKILGLDGWW